jgi:peptidyl-dipeptidase Dcp
MTNPLLSDWQTEFQLPPFAAFTDDDFAPAFDAAMNAGRAAYAAIAANPETPTYANTIEAMEMADDLLDRVGGVFWNLSGSDSNPAREALQRELSPKLSAYSSEIINNKALFQRIETLWDNRDTLGLTPEQYRVLMLYRRMFLRAGAALDGDAAQRMTEVKSRLATLGTTFTQNLLADERDWVMALDDLSGLPDFVVASARAAAEERGMDGPCRDPEPLPDRPFPAIQRPPRPARQSL